LSIFQISSSSRQRWASCKLKSVFSYWQQRL
jgi:hypothetical protein